MEAKAIESIDSIALACGTISSDHVRIDPVPGGAIPIVYDHRDGRRRAACTACDAAAYLGGYCAAKLPRGTEPLPLMRNP